MNNRIKKKKYKQRCRGHITAKKRQANKELCKRYPFLIPRIIWTDEIFWLSKPYETTLMEDFPKGWQKAFGLLLCEEIREDCLKHNYLHQLRFNQVKSKYGELRIYVNGVPQDSQINNIIDDYSILSQNICENCGRPDINMLNWNGWLQPVCRECFERINRRRLRKGYIKEIPEYDNLICKVDPGRMADERKVTRYSPEGGNEKVTYDVRPKAEKIRTKWRKEHPNETEALH